MTATYSVCMVLWEVFKRGHCKVLGFPCVIVRPNEEDDHEDKVEERFPNYSSYSGQMKERNKNHKTCPKSVQKRTLCLLGHRFSLVTLSNLVCDNTKRTGWKRRLKSQTARAHSTRRSGAAASDPVAMQCVGGGRQHALSSLFWKEAPFQPPQSKSVVQTWHAARVR